MKCLIEDVSLLVTNSPGRWVVVVVVVRFQASYWPAHPVMSLYSPQHLVRRAQNILTTVSSWGGVTELNLGAPGPGAFGSAPGSVDLRAAGSGADANLFSFRLGANLPLDDAARQELLDMQSVVHR